MIQFFWNYIRGYIRVKIVGDSPERFVNMCAHHNIKLWDFIAIGKIYSFNIALKDISDLKFFSEKTGMELSVVSKIGIPFISKELKKRPVFLPGLILSIVFIYLYTFLVWDISVVGNTQYSEDEIIKYLNYNNVYKTMIKSNVDTGNTTYMLRSHFSGIIWVSVHLEGSSLMIEVKESPQKSIQQNDISPTMDSISEVIEDGSTSIGYDIVAQSDGIISSIITRSGTPLVHEGDLVNKGDILVSGQIELIDDNGELIGHNYVISDADILLGRTSEYIDSIALDKTNKKYLSFPLYNIYLKVGDYYLELGIDIYNEFTCVKQVKEYQLHPSKQEKFNLVLGIQKMQKYEIEEEKLNKNEISVTLSERFNEYILEIKEKGVEIIENNVTIVIENNVAIASGVLKEEVQNTYMIATEILPSETNLEN